MNMSKWDDKPEKCIKKTWWCQVFIKAQKVSQVCGSTGLLQVKVTTERMCSRIAGRAYVTTDYRGRGPDANRTFHAEKQCWMNWLLRIEDLRSAIKKSRSWSWHADSILKRWIGIYRICNPKWPILWVGNPEIYLQIDPTKII